MILNQYSPSICKPEDNLEEAWQLTPNVGDPLNLHSDEHDGGEGADNMIRTLPNLQHLKVSISIHAHGNSKACRNLH